MFWPSVAGVEEAELFSRCIDSRSVLAITVSQSNFPEVASIRARRRSPFSVADVSKTLFSQTTGEECPVPRVDVFQAIFSVCDQRVGTFFSSEEPSPRGPRNCGQFSA